MQEMQVQPLGRKIPWRREWQSTPVFLFWKFHEQRNLAGFSLWATLLQRVGQDLATKWASLNSAGKESTCNAKDLGLIPGLGRSAGEGKGYTLQYSGLENSMDCNSMDPWGRKESDTTERLSLSLTLSD